MSELSVRTDRSPYTPHGHLVAGFDPTGWEAPPAVARCGGPGLCGDCSAYASSIRQAKPIQADALSRWFAEAHPELIGEGSAVENAIRLLDWAYVGVCEDPEGLPAAAIKARRPRGGDRMADALADLADALVGVRERIDRELDREAAERAEENDLGGQREPAEWEDALREIERWLRGVSYDVTVTRNDVAAGDAERIVASLGSDAAKRIVEKLDEDLHKPYGALRYALRTVAGKAPKDLRREAVAFADRHGAQGPARVAAIEAYLAGAGVEL